MKRNKGFTMIELMIAIVIVAILAAVVAPMMRGRVERAKWSEAMGGCSSIATALRSWAAENIDRPTTVLPTDLGTLGFLPGDLEGKYFAHGAADCDYEITGVGTVGAIAYTITVTPTKANAPTGTLTLDATGTFTLEIGDETMTF